MKCFRKCMMAAICLISICTSLIGCGEGREGKEFDMLESIMIELSQKQSFHVIMQKEHIIDGVSERGSDDEIWQNRDNWAMTIHLTDSEKSNILFCEGVFYIQEETDGGYKKSTDSFSAPILWPGVLNTVTAEEISTATLQNTADGSVLTVTFPSDKEDETDITAIITMDAHGNVTSITTKTAWNVMENGRAYSIEAIYITLFLSFEETEIAKVIEARQDNIIG